MFFVCDVLNVAKIDFAVRFTTRRRAKKALAKRCKNRILEALLGAVKSLASLCRHHQICPGEPTAVSCQSLKMKNTKHQTDRVVLVKRVYHPQIVLAPLPFRQLLRVYAPFQLLRRPLLRKFPTLIKGTCQQIHLAFHLHPLPPPATEVCLLSKATPKMVSLLVRERFNATENH